MIGPNEYVSLTHDLTSPVFMGQFMENGAVYDIRDYAFMHSPETTDPVKVTTGPYAPDDIPATVLSDGKIAVVYDYDDDEWIQCFKLKILNKKGKRVAPTTFIDATNMDIRDVAIVGLDDGGIALVWSYHDSDLSQYLVKAQVLENSGTTMAAAFTVDSGFTNTDAEVKVCSDGNGGFYFGHSYYDSGASEYGLRVQQYTSAGAASGDPIDIVTDETWYND